MNKKRWAGAWILSVAVALVLSGCSGNSNNNNGRAASPASPETSESPSASPAANQELQKIRYAPLNGVSGLAVRFGADKGFFKEEGLDVEFITTKNAVEGLTSKDVDIADVATTTAIIAAGKGAPIKIVSSMFRTKGPFYLIAAPGINSVEELKGKKVGAAVFGSGLDVYTQKILQQHGLTKDDVTYVANGAQEAAYASLESGQVDATIIHEPFASLVEITGKGKLLAKGWDYLPNFHTGVLASRNDFIEKNPELIEKLLRAYFKSQEYAKNNIEEYKAYFLENVKVDPKAVDSAFEREKVLWENNPNVDANALLETQQIQVELGFQDEIYDVEKILDLRFIPKQ
ncbi:ABC transporter substrate-binding protein [Paenibacillus sp. NEAU-GSW1]|uniref:ABC transporter substrate-binding protein n=1 Tax=Paenibacillus sp. NEAU-GSW1 TaxID=2682486 RepID=UPI0012E2AC2D|nr:ABC transporter substrate-binding protein [Paenibacillus sp. NEAU-GSW1]MUT65945.1 transporter substrate-binding domain-containing protein [Paenibacillus sp. NEAU-GSW1]